MTTMFPMVPRPFVVCHTRRETADTVTLDIAPCDRDETFSYRPGQISMLYVFGKGEIPLSMSGDTRRTGVATYTVRDVGAVSHAITALKPGAIVGVRGPFGAPWPVEDAYGKELLLIAGGVGMAPLRPALYAAIADFHKFRAVSLLYGARTPQQLLFAKELKTWKKRINVVVTVDMARPKDKWHGEVGLVTSFIQRLVTRPEHTVAMVCGPDVMFHFSAMELRARGIEPHSIYLSLERNMKCAVGHCGRCQLGPHFICKDGPVFRYDQVMPFIKVQELPIIFLRVRAVCEGEGRA